MDSGEDALGEDARGLEAEEVEYEKLGRDGNATGFIKEERGDETSLRPVKEAFDEEVEATGSIPACPGLNEGGKAVKIGEAGVADGG